MKEVRPTSGKLLLALMSILESKRKLYNCLFLDLFAGTGRVGIEALNRGAEAVYFVETLKNRALDITNSVPLEYKNLSTVLSLELRRAFNWLIKRGIIFDIIFADPPYNEGWNKTLVPALEKNHLLLKDDGVFIYEHPAKENIDYSAWKLSESRTYGESAISFFSKENLY